MARKTAPPSIDFDAFRSEWNSGEKSLRQLASLFGLKNTDKVRYTAKILHLSPRPSRPDKFDSLKDRFTELYNQGLTYSQIQEQLGINALAIKNWRSRLNLQKRPKGGIVKLAWDEDLKALEEYVTINGAFIVDELGAALGMSKQRVVTLRKKSKIVDSFSLQLPSVTKIYFKASQFYGNDLGKVILYPRRNWIALARKLIDIISPNVKQNLKGRDWESSLRNRLKNNTQIPSIVIDAIVYGVRLKLDEATTDQITNLMDRTRKALEEQANIRITLNYRASNQHQKESDSALMTVEQIMQILYESDKVTMVRIVSAILNILGYAVMHKDDQDSDIDLVATREFSKIAVSIKGHQIPLLSDIISVNSLARQWKMSGLIVTLQHISEDQKMRYLQNNGPTIWDWDHLSNLLSSLPTLPPLQEYLIKVEKGKFASYHGIVKSIDTSIRKTLIKIIDFPRFPTISCSINDIKPLSYVPDTNEYVEFVKQKAVFIDFHKHRLERLSRLMDENEFIALLQTDELDLQSRSSIDAAHVESYLWLIGKMNDLTVHLNVTEDTIGRMSCDCFYWFDNSDKKKICRHIGRTVIQLPEKAADYAISAIENWAA